MPDTFSLEEARALWRLALLLDAARANAGLSSGQPSAEALQGLRATEEGLAAEAAAREPRLKTELKLVLRNVSLEEAIAQAASAAGLRAQVERGALDDSAALAGLPGRDALRITYLDLSGRTAAEAFGRLCAPANLDWRVERGRVQVTNARRGALAAPWVYDVAALAVPGLAEMVEGQGDVDLVKATGAEAAAVLEAARTAAGAARFEHCFWLAPGQLAVHADARGHAKVAELIEQLKSGSRRAGPLAARTSARYLRRREALAQVEKARAEAEAQKLAAGLVEGGWRLLTAASAGECAGRTVALVQAACGNADARRHLAAQDPPLDALRFAWMAGECAAASPGDRELSALARAALADAADSTEKALAAAANRLPEPATDNRAALTAALYGALALEDGVRLKLVRARRAGDLRQKVLAAAERKEAPEDVRLLARALLAPRSEAAGRDLAALFEKEGLAGDDLNLLAALAARRLDGETWPRFREAARERFRAGGASGRVVLIASRLSRPLLPAAKP